MCTFLFQKQNMAIFSIFKVIPNLPKEAFDELLLWKVGRLTCEAGEVLPSNDNESEVASFRDLDPKFRSKIN